VTLTGKARAVQSVTMPIPAGVKCHFSLWGKADFPTPGALNFYVRWLDKDAKEISVINSPALTATSDWKN